MELVAPRAIAVIVRDNRLLAVRRTVPDRTYYVLPGGSIEENESPAEACRREAKEETGLAVRIQRKLMSVTNGQRVEHYFLVEPGDGVVRLGGPEAQRNAPTNQYELVWVDAAQLVSLPLFPAAALNAGRLLLSEATAAAFLANERVPPAGFTGLWVHTSEEGGTFEQEYVGGVAHGAHRRWLPSGARQWEGTKVDGLDQV